MKKLSENLSDAENLKLIFDKLYKKQYITYEEYVTIAMTNYEVYFRYNENVYQIDHGIKGITSMYITKYDNNKKVCERSEHYTSVTELLEQFRVDGKSIKDLWKYVNF